MRQYDALKGLDFNEKGERRPYEYAAYCELHNYDENNI